MVINAEACQSVPPVILLTIANVLLALSHIILNDPICAFRAPCLINRLHLLHHRSNPAGAATGGSTCHAACNPAKAIHDCSSSRYTTIFEDLSRDVYGTDAVDK